MDIGNTMRMMKAWKEFAENHPKFPAFCKAVMNRGIRKDTIIEVVVITPEGERIETNLRVKQEDLDLFESLKSMN